MIRSTVIKSAHIIKFHYQVRFAGSATMRLPFNLKVSSASPRRRCGQKHHWNRYFPKANYLIKPFNLAAGCWRLPVFSRVFQGLPAFSTSIFEDLLASSNVIQRITAPESSIRLRFFGKLFIAFYSIVNKSSIITVRLERLDSNR